VAVELIWSARARADLLDIYLRIGRERRDAAERFLDRIEEKAISLTTQPRLGVRRSDIRSRTRMLVERPYLLLYETIPDTDVGPVQTVEIVRVVDGRRDLKAMFKSGT
jgi:toxin ParE1/3/4